MRWLWNDGMIKFNKAVEKMVLHKNILISSTEENEAKLQNESFFTKKS